MGPSNNVLLKKNSWAGDWYTIYPQFPIVTGVFSNPSFFNQWEFGTLGSRYRDSGTASSFPRWTAELYHFEQLKKSHLDFSQNLQLFPP